MSYSWPGNIRELGTVIDRAAILGDGKTLEIAKALGTGAPLPPFVEAVAGHTMITLQTSHPRRLRPS